jgi:transposase
MPTMLRRANAPAGRARAAAERARRQARRLQAAELFAQGVRPAQVARTLGVSKQSTSRWHAAWEGGGVPALASKGPTGVRSRLSDADLERVAQALGKGASAHGFTGELWTLRRIATVIERLTGVRYHLGHLWAVLHHRMGWSVQRPIRRAAERDEAAIARWVAEDWPRIKANARRRKARIVFFDESGASLLPNVRRTWAPVGQPPVLRHPFNWKRASMAAALCYGAGGGGASLCFHVHPGSYDTDSLIEVIGQLRGFLGGEKATLLWDGLPAHRSKAMAAFLTTQRDWLVVERLPGYAPELNPVEQLWANLKGNELANVACEGLGGVIAAAWQGIERTRAAWQLPYSFLRHCGLSVA